MTDIYPEGIVRRNAGNITIVCAALVLGTVAGYGVTRTLDTIMAQNCRDANPAHVFNLSPNDVAVLGEVGMRMVYDSDPAHFVTEHTPAEPIVADINAGKEAERVVIEIPFVPGQQTITREMIASAALAGEVIRAMSRPETIIEDPIGAPSDVAYPAKWIQVTTTSIC